MAAEQAAKLADRKVWVLQTRTIPQGLSAMLSYDPEANVEENKVAMTKGFEKVATGQITFAARDSEFENLSIKKGELLAIENGKLIFTDKDFVKTATKLTRSMIKRDSAFVTLIYGQDVSETEIGAVEEALRAKISPDIEVTVINGGQPVYYLIVSVE